MPIIKIEVRNYLVDSLLVQRAIKTRSELTFDSGFPRSTIYDNLTKLICEGKIVKKDKIRATAGRRAAFYMAADNISVLSESFAQELFRGELNDSND